MQPALGYLRPGSRLATSSSTASLPAYTPSARGQWRHDVGEPELARPPDHLGEQVRALQREARRPVERQVAVQRRRSRAAAASVSSSLARQLGDPGPPVVQGLAALADRSPSPDRGPRPGAGTAARWRRRRTAPSAAARRRAGCARRRSGSGCRRGSRGPRGTAGRAPRRTRGTGRRAPSAAAPRRGSRHRGHRRSRGRRSADPPRCLPAQADPAGRHRGDGSWAS